MKRTFLLAVAGLAAAGCYTSPSAPYQPASFAPCPQSLVDYVVVTYNTPSGPYVDPSLPQIGCLYNGVQGATFLGQPPGPYTYAVTAYQNVPGLGPVAVYSGQTTLNTGPYGGDVVLYWDFDRYNAAGVLAMTYDALLGSCGGAPCADVHLGGIFNDFAIFANLVNSLGTATLGTYCTDPGLAPAGGSIDSLSYSLVDHFGTPIDTATMYCGTSLADPAGVSYTGASGLDLDLYSIRLVGKRGGVTVFDSATTANAASFPACAGQTFGHYGRNLDGFAGSWDVWAFDVQPNLTLCP